MAGRTWLAVAIACFIWFAYLKWFAPPVPNDATSQTPSSTAGSPATEAPALPLFAKPIEAKPSAPVTSGRLNVVFSEAGGKISEADVTTYRETIKSDSPYIAPVSPKKSTFALATLFSEPALESFSSGPYQRKDGTGVVHFTRSAEGITVDKDYKLNEGPYSIETTYKISFPSGQRREWGYLAIPVGDSAVDSDAKDPLKSWEVVAYQNESVTRKAVEKIDAAEMVLQGTTSWLAFGNRYFSSVLVNHADLNPDVVLTKTKQFVGAYLRYPLRLKEGQNDITIKLTTYIGPKDYNELSKTPGLRRLIDYGMFSFLAYPLLYGLKAFYKIAHNYGIAIILLTILVRAILYPLSVKSYQSMKAMQKLQPQLQALKEKYKGDPQRFNQEQMALFKTHKVNPAGGCLPMLVQLPVFIALYAVLGNSIELFHAPFFGWIHDLSSKDPLYIFPVLMGISMFAQQKLTPNAGMDPAQAKMMLIMPVVFTFIMLNLPSGLTVYIFLSTLLGVAQQLSMNRGDSPAGAKLAPAKT